MSHDPQSPTDAADLHWDDDEAEDDEADAFCCDCGEPLFAERISVEAFERFSALLCDECFTERCEEE